MRRNVYESERKLSGKREGVVTLSLLRGEFLSMIEGYQEYWK